MWKYVSGHFCKDLLQKLKASRTLWVQLLQRVPRSTWAKASTKGGVGITSNFPALCVNISKTVLDASSYYWLIGIITLLSYTLDINTKIKDYWKSKAVTCNTGLRNLQNHAKFRKNWPYSSSRSSKVIDLGANGKHIFTFLLVTNILDYLVLYWVEWVTLSCQKEFFVLDVFLILITKLVYLWVVLWRS